MGKLRVGSLPSGLSEVVGRRSELEAVREAFAHVRLVTLTGVAGVGKTRLSIEAARRLSRVFPGGVWFVELAAVSDSALTSSAVAEALGVPLAGSQPLEVRIASKFRRTASLLVLDNCEHVLMAAADLGRALLEECSDLRILCTSREPLGIAGESTLQILPLEVPDSVAALSVDDALAFAAVRLFVERATAAHPSFSLTTETVPAVADICRRLGGIPLGLELVAVRLRSLSLDDLLERLDDQLTLPNLSGRTSTSRHQTLGASLDWSYRLLSQNERTLWRRLSVFSGTFTLEAACVVCSGGALNEGSVFDSLSMLLEKSVVIADRGAERVRYRLLEPIRLYGRERLRDSREEQAFQRQHLEWCRGSTFGSAPWWMGENQLEHFERIADEHANLCAALAFCLADEALTETGLELIDQVSLAWLVRGRYQDVLHHISRLIAHSSTQSRALVRGLYTAGIAEWAWRGVDAGRPYFLAARRASAGKKGYGLERGLALYGLGVMEVRDGHGESGRSLLRGAIDLLDRSGAEVMHASALLFIAESYDDDPLKLSQARALVEQSLAISERSGDVWNRSRATYWAGIIEWHLGQAEAAEHQLVAAVLLQMKVGHRIGIAMSLEALGQISARSNRTRHAVQLLGAIDALHEELHIESPSAARDEISLAGRRILGATQYEDMYTRGHRLDLEELLRPPGEHRSARASLGGPVSAHALTNRELDVARLIAKGASNREIALALVFSPETAKFHVRNIMVKLGVHRRSEIAAWIVRSGDRAA